MANAVILFDIDGTLIRRAGPHHREALVEAVRSVTGMAAPIDHIPVQGMLDRRILEWMMRDAGASPSLIRKSMPEIVRRAQAIYQRTAPRDLRAKRCPGALQLLRRLHRLGVPAGLVTGNLSRIAWRKMESAGLRRYLRFGAFAELAATREELVRAALGHARRRGWLRPETRTWHVGDHPNDVLAARANGIRSVGVATGLSPREELAVHSPDLLIDDFESLELERILNG